MIILVYIVRSCTSFDFSYSFQTDLQAFCRRTMQLWVKLLTGNTMVLDVDPDELIKNVCLKIQDRIGIPWQTLRLCRNSYSRLMKSSDTLKDYNVNKDSILWLHSPIGGIRVHIGN